MGCIFIPLAGDFFSIKKMSDYYGEYLFSSPTGAFLISIISKELGENILLFSSPSGAYLISISNLDIKVPCLAEGFRPLPGHI